VHPAEETEADSWFQAKEPPPDHTGPAAPADQPAADEDDDQDEDGTPRGRHSATPDVNVVQRPN
jgi:hypothetical protein